MHEMTFSKTRFNTIIRKKHTKQPHMGLKKIKMSIMKSHGQ